MQKYLTLFALCLPVFLLAQEVQIQGSLKTTQGKAVAYANVVIQNKQNQVLAFNSSDTGGHFSITLPDNSDLTQLLLKIRHLGYKQIAIPLQKSKINYSMVLEEEAIDLSEIAVKSRPRIDHKGDTLNYDVASFAENEDRSIGDVIKRMPGMEVGENGEIKFNGKRISHFYIDGDDLLSNRYAIGSKTIPHAMVKGVEVLQNHQPVRVLQHKVLSDEVAINLVIREEAKLKMTGQVKLGLGLPHQYDEELNSILFNKKYKVLNVLKGNNVGEDLAPVVTGKDPEALLSAGTVGNPDVPRDLYYLNQSGSLAANNLINLKSGLQLKSNINLWLDKNQLEYHSFNDLYLNEDTIRYNERQDIAGKPYQTELMLTAENNKETHYIKDELSLAYTGNTDQSSLFSNELDMQQQLKAPVRAFSNRLEYIPVLKNKHLIRAIWNLSYFNRNEQLFISPGVHTAVLNADSAYAATRQTVVIPSWSNALSFSYIRANGLISQQYRAGLENELQRLQSALCLEQRDGRLTPDVETTDNDLSWFRNRLYGEAAYAYKKGRFESSINIPLAWQTLKYADESVNLDVMKHWLMMTPSLRIKYLANAEDDLSLTYAYNRDFGTIHDVYRGTILTNYRTLQANQADLQEKNSHDIGLRYHFQRSIRLLFMNAAINWSKAGSNSILSSRVSNSVSQSILLPLQNDVSTWNAAMGTSKYIFALGATAAINISWNRTRYNQLLNDELLPYNNVTWTLNPSIETRLWNRISLNYNATASWIHSRQASGGAIPGLPEQRIQLYNMSLRGMVTLWKNLFLSVSGRQQVTRQEQSLSYFFADANARFRVQKWRSDIELNLRNLANITDYETYGISANSLWYSRYTLRGRMAVLTYTFNL